LTDDPGHDLARQQQDGFGGMLSFELADMAAAQRCLTGLTCFSLAESLGGVESLICHPASMTHAAMPPDVQAAAGISDGMLRIAVGIEEIHDLVDDLRAGLDRALRT
jgi:cystathionine gamma-synthase